MSLAAERGLSTMLILTKHILIHIHTLNEKNLQKSAILFGTKSNAYLQINRPIFTYSWLFLPIFAYLQICSKSPRIYFAFCAKYPCLFLPIFRDLTCACSFHQLLHISHLSTYSVVTSAILRLCQDV